MCHVIFFKDNGGEPSEFAHLGCCHDNTAQTVISADVYLMSLRYPEPDMHDIPGAVSGRVELEPVCKRFGEYGVTDPHTFIT